MKTIITLAAAFLLLLPYCSKAQAPTPETDTIIKEVKVGGQPGVTTTKIEVPGKVSVTITTDSTGQVREVTYDGTKKEITYKTKRTHRSYNYYFDQASFHLGINNVDNTNMFTGKSDAGGSYLTFPDLITNKSVSFAMYPIKKGFSLYRDRLGAVVGLGIEWFNFRFSHQQTIASINDLTYAVPAWQEFDLNPEYYISKSKLTATYINVPIMLQYNVGQRYEKLHLSAGAIFGANIGSHTKIKYYDNDDDTHKKKGHDSFNLSPFRCGLVAEISYNCIGAYANYYFTPLFKNNQGPQVYPFVVGIFIYTDDMWW